ncbi:MAG: hypothetical protein AAGA60_02980 [Cyanobacteria bacterium P01_E01_bin.42]
MIVFVPGYDPSTYANLKIARLLNPSNCILLFENKATREELVNILEISKFPLFVMSHGISNAFKAQPDPKPTNRKEVQTLNQENIAFSNMDVTLLKQRTVYAFACNTAQELGEVAANFGSIWWGYSDTVPCPFDNPNPEVTTIFVDIFDFIKDNFTDPVSSEDIQIFLDKLKIKCENSAEQIDLIDAQEEFDDILAIYATLIQIWDRLRVWLPGQEQPEQHPHSSSPSLSWKIATRRV